MKNILYNECMELKQVANYINGRFLITNMKTEKKSLLKGQLLASYSVDSLGKGKNEQVYYDTADFFFADKGINIYTMSEGKTRELIIRYDSEQVNRIEFLKNTPNFFKIQIDKNDSILAYSDQINEAIYKVFPSGLGINIEENLRQCSPVIKIVKKRDSYRVVNNTGLKMILNYETCTYFNTTNRRKFSQPVLDVFGESPKYKEDFDLFLKHIVRDHPQLIKLPDNELSLARTNLQ